MGIGDEIKPNNNKFEAKTETASKKEEKTISFDITEPKYTLDNLVVPEATLTELRKVLTLKDNHDLVFNQWGLQDTHKTSKRVGINLYGPPGTGKTLGAHAIASHLGKKLIIVNYADIESKYVGETSKNITSAFKFAQENDAILMFDEADAMLSRRVTNMSHSTDTAVNQTRSVLLTLMNDYEGVLIFTTNFVENYDPAFMRRILAHIKFDLPDEKCRFDILTKHIPVKMPHKICIETIAKEFDGVSGSDISNAVLMSAFSAAERKSPHVDHDDLVKAIQNILDSKEANSNNTSDYKVVSKRKLSQHELQQRGFKTRLPKLPKLNKHR